MNATAALTQLSRRNPMAPSDVLSLLEAALSLARAIQTRDAIAQDDARVRL